MIDAVTDKTLLQQYRELLGDWIPQNASIAIALQGKYVYFASGSHNIHLEIGTPVQPNSIAYTVLQTQKKVDALMENTIFDTPYYAIGYPIILEGHPAALIIILPPSFQMPKNEPYSFLTGRQDDDWTPVTLDKISHIESLQKHTWFYANNEQYRTSITLKELETRLPDNFIRIHRSYIINLHYIKKISRDITSNFILILQNQTQLPVSQSYLTNVRKLLQF